MLRRHSAAGVLIARLWLARVQITRVFITALLALSPGCVAPLIVDVGEARLGIEHYPGGSRIVQQETADGAIIRGVHVPAGPGAPLVLHLLPRGAASTTGLEPFGGFVETLSALRRSGHASLVMDHRGVGASMGATDSARLADDAAAMWEAALLLCGGDESRVVLRGASLGSLAAISILSEGARPRAVVLIAPVDAATVVEHAMVERAGFLGRVASAFIGDPDIAGLRPVLAATDRPVLVILPERDALLPAGEAASLRRAAAKSVSFEVREKDHEALVLHFYGFDLDDTSGRVVTTLDPAEARFLRMVGER